MVHSKNDKEYGPRGGEMLMAYSKEDKGCGLGEGNHIGGSFQKG